MKTQAITYNTSNYVEKFMVSSLAIISLFSFISCQNIADEEFTFEEIAPIAYDIDKSESTLSARIQPVHKIASIEKSELFNSQLKGNETASNSNDNYYWEYVADLAPMTVNNSNLSVSHISLNNNKAFISYHKEGIQQLGAIETIDLSNIDQPKVISKAIFPNSDINAISTGFSDHSSSQKIWLAMSNEESGAHLFEIDTQDGLLTNINRQVNLSNTLNSGVSTSANAIAITNNYLYVTAGNDFGGMVQLDINSLSIVGTERYQNAKYVVANGTTDITIAALSTGKYAQLNTNRVYRVLKTNSFSIGEIQHQNIEDEDNGHATMEFSPLNKEYLYISKGKFGLGLYDIKNGSLLNKSHESMLSSGNTNAVTTDDNFIYMANGTDGIAIAPHPTSKNEDIIPAFQWDLEDPTDAANYVIAKGDWIFVATSKGGVKILRRRTKDNS
ncbi:LVIVD repeat-containing protein [Flavicella sediminum]|uniref:hypothetical protein n=1 Tax=Flavicella sediminum TaxID=2585141 RepID=UPI001121F0D4|nr:hypothetical protein [Flavicella sediminum]